MLYLHHKFWKLSHVHLSIRILFDKFLKILSHLKRLIILRYWRVYLHLLWSQIVRFTEFLNILIFKARLPFNVPHVPAKKMLWRFKNDSRRYQHQEAFLPKWLLPEVYIIVQSKLILTYLGDFKRRTAGTLEHLHSNTQHTITGREKFITLDR